MGMKKTHLLAVLLCLATQANADPVPAPIDAALKNLKMQHRTLEMGVLRIVMDVPLVSPAMFSTAVALVCGEQIQSRKQLASMHLDRIEVLNHVNAQGYALPGGKSTCDRTSRMNSTEAEQVVQGMAERCEAGVCRQRK